MNTQVNISLFVDCMDEHESITHMCCAKVKTEILPSLPVNDWHEQLEFTDHL